MSIPEKMYDRNNADRFAHPEVKERYAGISSIDPQRQTFFFDESIPLEERDKKVQDMINVMLASPMGKCNYEQTEYQIPGCPEEPDAPLMSVFVVEPEKRLRKSKNPVIILYPSGGLYYCSPAYTIFKGVADNTGATVIYNMYRTYTRGGHYPYTVNDCHALYKWVYENAEMLKVDPDCMVLFGVSAGGHLALSTAHRLKKYGYKPRGCVVCAPILDERENYPSAKYLNNGWGCIQCNVSTNAWIDHMDSDKVPADALASHATTEECIGLPPTFIHTYESDPQVDPSLAYASKLNEAGVYTEIHEWGGTAHLGVGGSMGQPEEFLSDYEKRCQNIIYNNLIDCIRYDLRRE